MTSACVVLETNGSNAATLYRTPTGGCVKGGAQLYEQENALGSALRTVGQDGLEKGATMYDAYGRETAASGDRGEFRFAGQKGYVSDDATGMDLLGARYYVPALGRFLTQDPVGHEGGLNLYAYCGDSPLLRSDAGGKDWNTFWGSVKSAFTTHIARPAAGWAGAVGHTSDFLLGLGPDHMSFGPNTLETYQAIHSDIGFSIESAIIDSGYMTHGRRTLTGNSGSLMPFISTLAQPSNGTQAFIGGYTWSASRYGNTIAINVHNETTMNSLFYHWLNLSRWKGPDRTSNGFGPMGNTYQDYHWTLPVPNYWRDR